MAHMTGVMTRSLAAAATLALTLAPSARGPVTAGANPAEGDAGYSKTQNVMSLANSDGVPGRLYVTNQFTVSRGGDIVDYVAGNSGDGSMLAAEYKAVETGKTTQERVKAGQRVLPWSVSIAYGLNGPQVKPSQIAGASGLVDIRITVEPNAAVSNGYAENSIPVVAFTVPSSVLRNRRYHRRRRHDADDARIRHACQRRRGARQTHGVRLLYEREELLDEPTGVRDRAGR